MAKVKFVFPNSEKRIEINELMSRDDEKFIDLNFFEDEELKFDVKINKAQLDYLYDLAMTALKEE